MSFGFIATQNVRCQTESQKFAGMKNFWIPTMQEKNKILSRPVTKEKNLTAFVGS